MPKYVHTVYMHINMNNAYTTINPFMHKIIDNTEFLHIIDAYLHTHLEIIRPYIQ